MKKGLTEVVFILDRSGSMSSLTTDTIGGFNSFVDQQKKEDGECFLTTILFDDQYEVLHDHIDIQEVAPLTDKEYFARGMTALLDATGKAINTVGSRLASTDEDERPENVIVVITTDGQENSSKEFDAKKIKEMVSEQESKYNWSFLFLGANIDAFAEGGTYGFDVSRTAQFTADSIGTQSLYSSVTNFVADTRAGSRDLSATLTDYMTTATTEVKKTKKTKVKAS